MRKDPIKYVTDHVNRHKAQSVQPKPAPEETPKPKRRRRKKKD